MILRPRQQTFTQKCVKALKTHGNTLGIGPTGSGKTVMLSAVAGKIGGTSLVIQHRDELVRQNERTFRRVNPNTRTSFYTADYKRFGGEGTATFSMIQTLVRNLDDMPPVDLLVVDEAHHVAADTYVRVINRAKQLNPKMKLFGVTATPGRGDSRNLRASFDNVADQITIEELIAAGHLVMPRCFVIDLGTRKELAGVRKTANDFDMTEVEAIMNTRPLNEKVVEKWREHAGDRKTVVFASTVAHAADAMAEFHRQGVSAKMIHGAMKKSERIEVLDAYDRCEFQVLMNVMVLTEGWDCPPVSCVVLLRPCSFKSTLIQMIGRGLRTIDPERYPGIVKDDCIVLDFGFSLHTHRELTQLVNLDREEGPIECPACEATIPAQCFECPICGETIREPEEKEEAGDGPAIDTETTLLHDFVMTEIELFAKSPFKWEDFFDGRVTVANALEAWAAVVHYGGRWVAIGGAAEIGIKCVAGNADRLLSLSAADDFLRTYGDDKTAAKSKRWITLPPSLKQLEFLGVGPMGAMGMSRYRASCAITWKTMERSIRSKLMNQAPPAEAMVAA